MSLMPESAPQPPEELVASVQHRTRMRAWRSRLLGVCFAIFTFEIGLFLVIFPWLDAWNSNYFPKLTPALQDIWRGPYFRGALTGLGLVNLYVAFLEVARLLRRA
jgi:hypothetical protein